MEKLWKVTLSNGSYEDSSDTVYLFQGPNEQDIVIQVKNHFNESYKNGIIGLSFPKEKETYYAGNYTRKNKDHEYEDIEEEYSDFMYNEMSDGFECCDPCYFVSINEIKIDSGNSDKINYPSLYKPKNKLEYEILAGLNRDEKDLVANWLSFSHQLFKANDNTFIIEISDGQALDGLLDVKSDKFHYDFGWMLPRLKITL